MPQSPIPISYSTVLSVAHTVETQTRQILVLMMVSLVIQVFLTFLAPLRKRKASGFLTIILWLLYLLATPVSLFTIGLISRLVYTYGFKILPWQKVKQGRGVWASYMLWASFSLLHLGSADTIASLSLEDNELWLRQALQLVTQVSLTLYVFGLFIYEMEHRLKPIQWLCLATFMFTNGLIKYIERICALYFSSKEGIRASSRNREALLVKTFETKDNCSGDEEIHADDEFEIVKHAYLFYEEFRCHLADDVITLNDGLGSRTRLLFLHQPINIGLRIIEAELNLIYDIFHTKVFFMFMKRAFLRITCFLLVIASALLYFSIVSNNHQQLKKPRWPMRLMTASSRLIRASMNVTVALYAGTILLDIASFIGFLFSDWCIVMVVKLLDDNPSKVLRWFLLVLQKWLRRRNSNAKRWCEMCSSYNLLDCSLNQTILNKFINMIRMKRIKDFLIDWLYVKKQPIKRSCVKFIFQELQQKAKLANGDKQAIKQVCSARGNLVFENNPYYHNVSTSLHPWTVNVHYCQSILTWHLATDICYWADFCNNDGDNSLEVDYHSLSKQLSDYMAYILLRQPEMVPQLVDKSDYQFEHTKSDIIHAYAVSSPSDEGNNLKSFCTSLLQQQSQASENPLSVLEQSCSLAKKLNELDRENKWKTICKVWVEMLCFAAIRSLPRYNFAQLSKGGELITLVWLYMTQLGFLPSKLSD